MNTKHQLAGKRIVIAGESGFLGLSMAAAFGELDAEVTILSRSKPQAAGDWTHRAWDGRTLGDWSSAIDGCDAVVNLAGRTVNCIKTPDHCDEILRSRVESTRVLGEAMRSMSNPPPVWVLNQTRKRTYVPQRGDLIWISLQPISGHEQSGRRSAFWRRRRSRQPRW